MATLPADVTAAVASLQARWGAAAPRITDGALALAPATAPSLIPVPNQPPTPTPARTPDRRNQNHVAVFLLSADARHVTGQVIHVNGGAYLG